MNGPREWLVWFAVLVGSVFALGFVAGDALGASGPPVLHVGPPATAPGVACSRTTLRDLVRGQELVLERCYRTQPAALPPRFKPGADVVCSLLRPCPLEAS